MASSGSVFSHTLQTITATKLEELAKQRNAFEDQYGNAVTAANAESDPLKRLSVVVDGAKIAFDIKTAPSKDKTRPGRVIVGGTSKSDIERDLRNMDRFLEQARHDPSISPKVVEDWEKSILQYFAVHSSKLQYADLYGKLVTEWLSVDQMAPQDDDVEMNESFEELPGVKKLEARVEWEKSVFEAADVDKNAVTAYLQRLFNATKTARNALNALRAQVAAFENQITEPIQFGSTSLEWVITDLLNSDLLSNDKRETLKDFLGNAVILNEIADVLNMRIAALSRWTWGEHVPLEQRRKLNGSYSVHMHEDLLQAIFLQYIGVRWSVFLKRTLREFGKAASEPAQSTIPKGDLKRRFYYLGKPGVSESPSLRNKRAKTHDKRYSLYQLFDFESQQIKGQEGEEEAEFAEFAADHGGRPKRKRAKRMAQTQGRTMALTLGSRDRERVYPRSAMRARDALVLSEEAYEEEPIDYSDEGNLEEEESDCTGGPELEKKPIEAKQDLLHLLSTEIVVNRKLHGELTCIHATFESWNPLLPHETILSVFEFFGVSRKWLTFFKVFLEAPLKFIDDNGSEPRLRRRGTPGSHALSDLFGEVVLFCLDSAVKRDTGGGLLYRLYDDIWFWSHDYEKCVQAWSTIVDFSDTIGAEFHGSKLGSVRITNDPSNATIDDRLPKGDIRWGFLYLDPTTGRFQIDQKMVDAHISDLRTQLATKSDSIISYIRAWNTYAATFFTSNFGRAANCFGRAHVDMMLATHRRIQSAIFPGSSVAQFLKDTITARFGVSHIPDGFLYFPIELGGLALQSPFIPLLQIRDSVCENPDDILDSFLEAEQDAYVAAKRAFENGHTEALRVGPIGDPKWTPTDSADVFFPFEEFIRHRETLRNPGEKRLVVSYRELLQRPVEESVGGPVEITNALARLGGRSDLRSITGYWSEMEGYWKWVAVLYGGEMVERFGGFGVVEKGWLPMGIVDIQGGRRGTWKG
ncbi:hypothetical protein B0J11DRAFT_599189 [Dendryphion nanum]|uniref:Reverse transcriptase n=1 Tax=Dendryphion nanum TaxID=256645 RepID=A0A9P9D1I1_9PLEO|nr:hypothetical protein B0J11DRAFT_599189 [Dendryphion nanum]